MDSKGRMSINDAAKWADRKDCLYINGDYQAPMCAAVNQNDNRVDCLGSFQKVDAYMKAHPDQPLRRYWLDEVLEQIQCDEGEAACYLGWREEGVSWESV